MEAGYDVELSMLTGYCHVDDGRNILVRQFLASGCDELMFIDADIGWYAEDLVRFVGHDRDVVAGTYPQKSDRGRFPCQFLDGLLHANDGLLEVMGVPTGFLKIKRRVLQVLHEQAQHYRADSDDAAMTAEIFEREVVGQDRLSGDLNFCRKWRELGGRVFVDPELRLEHVGEKTWSGTFGSYLRRLNGLSLVRGIEKIKRREYERDDVIALFDEWDNDGWCAGHELLAACIEVAFQANTVIECGSGLTSLLMAATGAEVHSLEHDPVWAAHMRGEKDRLGLDSLNVHLAPLKGGWYSGYESLPWERCDVVVCDGPPPQLGSRDRIFDVLANKGVRPLVLRDDMTVAPVVEGYTAELMGTVRPFAVLRAA